MTETSWRMPRDDDDESPDKCRERRRRRIVRRRLSSISTGGSPPRQPPPSEDEGENPRQVESSAEVKQIRTVEKNDLPTASASSSSEDVETSSESQGEGPVSKPVYGTMSVSGRSRDMEDAVSVQTSLCRPKISQGQPVHFFAVFDGHGGPNVSALCREMMHGFVEEELIRLNCTGEGTSVGGSVSKDKRRDGGDLEEKWRKVMKKSFERMDEVAMSSCACGKVGFNCGCHPLQLALCGSTAVVALLTPEYIVVANCGDSRAVLCRAGIPVPLSRDHKPDRPDELARIKAAGGRIIFVNGARVQGILAMSRAIGDRYLKPFVTSEPEITVTRRRMDDECLIIGSDGLWDVLSSQLACEIARECLREGPPAGTLVLNPRPQVEDEEPGEVYPSRSALAAALLTRLALGRKSYDNISVIVVDLKKS